MRFIQVLISWLRGSRQVEMPTIEGEPIAASGRLSANTREKGNNAKSLEENDLESRRQHLRQHLLQTSAKFRVHLHISQVDDNGCEKDLGPWPEHVAQVSNLEDAMDLCTMLAHQISSFLFPKERAS